MSEKFERLRKRLKGIGDKGVEMGEKAAFGKTGRMVNSLLYPGASGAGLVTVLDKGVQKYRDKTRVEPGKRMRTGAARAGARPKSEERPGVTPEERHAAWLGADEMHAIHADQTAKSKERKALLKAYGRK